MPVTLTPRQDGKTWVKVQKATKENQFTGKDRKGFNSRSGAAVFTDPIRAMAEQPTTDKPAALIKHLRIIGARGEGDKIEDVLTAQGHALYELLMASARIQGIENSEFLVSADDAKKFLGIEHNDRLQSLIDQLWNTEVEYDFRVPGYSRIGNKIPLLLPDWIIDDSGKRYIAFSVHNAIKQIILTRHHYAKLEIIAFPKFSCKYTARLYPRLALIAGQDEPYRSWRVTPEELVNDIGFQFSGDFHFGNFEKGALKKVQADIDNHITRFTARYEVVRRPGRGNPVDHILFVVQPREAPLQEQRKAPLTADGYAELNASLKHEDSFYGEMPSAELLRQGATLTGYDALELLEIWKSNISQMHAYPTVSLPDADLLTGEEVFGLLHEQGIDAAFAHWCAFLKKKAVVVKPIPVLKHPEETSGTVIYHDPETGYRITHHRKLKDDGRYKGPFAYHARLTELVTDEARAIEYCDANHTAWKYFRAHLIDDEASALFTAMRIAANPAITHASRLKFLDRLAKKVEAAKSYDLGKVVVTVCGEDTFRMRSELAAIADRQV
ncbi:replication initiation protein [Rhizobium leguminosarum]|uniref:replication initiation protein n=1 Tax=Rhizobium leguminosarum TaxID=384 RepID=UPI001C981430|nr:replication initiation protein [Rhizobium leguminosarum]MBY5551107.1 replication initiation protein [Rhizobium leguminosarum]